MQLPTVIVHRGVVCRFAGFAPITGDAYYEGIHSKTEQRVTLLVPNEDAPMLQQRYFQNNHVH